MTKIYLRNLDLHIDQELSQGEEATGTVTRVVGNDLFYVTSPQLGSMVLTPDRIVGYEGEPLKKVGVVEGALVAFFGSSGLAKVD
jgi:hypothetical protein